MRQQGRRAKTRQSTLRHERQCQDHLGMGLGWERNPKEVSENQHGSAQHTRSGHTHISLSSVLSNTLRVKKPFILEPLSRAPCNFAAGAQALTPVEQWHHLEKTDAPLPALTCRTKAGQTQLPDLAFSTVHLPSSLIIKMVTQRPRKREGHS